jgi:hypothetical protein
LIGARIQESVIKIQDSEISIQDSAKKAVIRDSLATPTCLAKARRATAEAKKSEGG